VFVRIHNPQFDRSLELRPNEEIVFGRGVRDVGQLPNNSLVSRRHGLIAATETGFAVTSIGTYNGFVVRDTMTPSRLHIPVGMGPIELPFANAVVSFDHSVVGRLEIKVVGSELADRWEENWAPEAEHDRTITEHSQRSRSTNYPASAERPPLKRNARGEPYTWFWTLVAMCEGEITAEFEGVPSNSQLAEDLGYETKAIERHVAAIYLALDIHPGDYQRPRDTAVRRAVDRGLVTRRDLEQLDRRRSGWI